MRLFQYPFPDEKDPYNDESCDCYRCCGRWLDDVCFAVERPSRLARRRLRLRAEVLRSRTEVLQARAEVLQGAPLLQDPLLQAGLRTEVRLRSAQGLVLGE